MEPIVLGNQLVQQWQVDFWNFDYIVPDEQAQKYLETARDEYRGLLSLLLTIPDNRERARAIVQLEQSLMYATKAIVVASKGE